MKNRLLNSVLQKAVIAMGVSSASGTLQHTAKVCLSIALVCGTIACSDLTGARQLPDGVESPSMYNNREGAVRLTLATTAMLRNAITEYVIHSGLLTDELNNGGNPGSWTDSRGAMDPVLGSVGPYVGLHEVRSLSRLARGVLAKYVTGESTAWQGMLLLYEAYAEILLADGWCSGVPLSTMDFEKDWTYRPGSSTDQVYEHAITLLDSAIDLSADSLAVQSAVRILKARALVALGKYTDASNLVQSTQTSDKLPLRISFQVSRSASGQVYYAQQFTLRAVMSDAEGINGLPYLSSRDPRTFADTVRIGAYGNQPSRIVWFPRKYFMPDSTEFVLASGLEARLIEAEALLSKNNWQEFLSVLNSLRTTGHYSTIDTIRNGAEISRIDTAWIAGSGGVAGLSPLRDPGSTDARVDMLFAERAAWLFLTGNRQGDLRRMVRHYMKDKEAVYPTGEYFGAPDIGVYGTDIAMRIPDEERRNPLFTGCLSHE